MTKLSKLGNSIRQQSAACEKFFTALKAKQGGFKQINFPNHISLTIKHNPHKEGYKSAEQWFEFKETWIPDGEEFDYTPEIRQKCIEKDSIWQIIWYPDTPVGFCEVIAPSLEEALSLANQAPE